MEFTYILLHLTGFLKASVIVQVSEMEWLYSKDVINESVWLTKLPGRDD